MIYQVTLILFLILSLYKIESAGPIALGVYAIFHKKSYTFDRHSIISKLALYFSIYHLFMFLDGSMPEFIYNSISLALITFIEFTSDRNDPKRLFLLLPTMILIVIVLGSKFIFMFVLLFASMYKNSNMIKTVVSFLLIIFLFQLDWPPTDIRFTIKPLAKYIFSILFFLYFTFLALPNYWKIFDLIFYSLLISVYISVIVTGYDQNMILFINIVILSSILDQNVKEKTN